jgi:hypothetical protein
MKQVPQNRRLPVFVTIGILILGFLALLVGMPTENQSLITPGLGMLALGLPLSIVVMYSNHKYDRSAATTPVMSKEWAKTSRFEKWVGFASVCMPLVAWLVGSLPLSGAGTHISPYFPFLGVALGILSRRTFVGKVGIAFNLGVILLVGGLILYIRHYGLFGPNSRPGDF